MIQRLNSGGKKNEIGEMKKEKEINDLKPAISAPPELLPQRHPKIHSFRLPRCGTEQMLRSKDEQLLVRLR